MGEPGWSRGAAGAAPPRPWSRRLNFPQHPHRRPAPSPRPRTEILAEIEQQKSQARHPVRPGPLPPVAAGLATWSGGDQGTLIVKGQSRLLSDVTAIEDLERIRALFEVLETKEAMLRMLEATQTAEGVQIFIGAENQLFGHCGLLGDHRAPTANSEEQIVGAIGVIGPTRLKLCADHSDGRLHREGGRPAAVEPTGRDPTGMTESDPNTTPRADGPGNRGPGDRAGRGRHRVAPRPAGGGGGCPPRGGRRRRGRGRRGREP